MRLTKTLQLAAGAVTVNELTVAHVRTIVNDTKKFGTLDIRALLLDRFDEAVALFGDTLVFTGDAKLDDVSFSELAEIKQAFMEVNAAFLDMMGLADLMAVLTQPQGAGEAPTDGTTSTAVASPSSSADIAA